MNRFLSLRAGADTASAGDKKAEEFTGEAVGAGTRAYAHGAQFTEHTGDVVTNLYRRAEAIQRNFFRAFVSEEESLDPEDLLQIDGTFGSIGPGFVCLRIETAEHWELKLAKFLSTFFTGVITVVIILLIVIKSSSAFSMASSRYFIWNVAVAGVCLCLCLLTLASFAHRYIMAKRAGLEWSERRRRLSLQSLALLIIQTVNVTCMIGGLGPLIAKPCRWKQYSSAFLGAIQWTCWNSLFAVLVAMAHSLTILRRKPKATTMRAASSKRVKGAQLVMDAPILAVHWSKIIPWVFFEVWPVLLMWSFWGYASEPASSPSLSLLLSLSVDAMYTSPETFACLFTRLFPLPARNLTGGCEPPQTEPGKPKYECELQQRSIAFIVMLIVSVAMYMILYLFFSARTQDDFESRSYHEMKFVRIAYGIQHSYVLPLFLVLMFSIIVLMSVNINSCWTYVEQWLGMATWQATGAPSPHHGRLLEPTLWRNLTPSRNLPLAGTICACTMAYFYMPVVGRDRGVIRSLLQDFCWSQKAEAAEREARDEIIRRLDLNEKAASTKSPLFCVETCIRHLYVSNYVYSVTDDGANAEGGGMRRAQIIDEPGQSAADSLTSSGTSESKSTSGAPSAGLGNVVDAMALWEAECYEAIVEAKTDTVALALWSSKRLVLAFKGTSSAQNVMTDLNVLKVVHEPKRKVQVTAGFTRKLYVSQTPMVHRGFWYSWKKGGFDERIKRLVKWYIDTYHKDSDDPVELHVTGHSLGGALATLAALDLTKQFNVDTTVYTFGQPRVGNKAFATDYDATVTKHFSVAHGQDPVARVPKGAYKKNGIRVAVLKTGDVVVAPSSLESHVLNSTPEIKDHMLESYRRAWMVSIKQQFGPKQITSLTQSGRIGASTLASDVALDLALLGSNMDIKSLESFGVHPLTEEDIAKLREKVEKMRLVEEGDAQGAGCAPSLTTNTLPRCCGKPDTRE